MSLSHLGRSSTVHRPVVRGTKLTSPESAPSELGVEVAFLLTPCLLLYNANTCRCILASPAVRPPPSASYLSPPLLQDLLAPLSLLPHSST